jgi:hypothetical protein
MKNGKTWTEEFLIGNTSGTYQGEFDRSLSGVYTFIWFIVTTLHYYH